MLKNNVASTGGQFDVLASLVSQPETEIIEAAAAPALSNFERIEVKIGDQPVGRFSSLRRRKVYKHFQEDEIDTLVAIKGLHTALVDALFFPL